MAQNGLDKLEEAYQSPLLYTLNFLKEWVQVPEKEQTELHGMVSDPMVLKDPNGKYFVGTLTFDALYNKWYCNAEERLSARKHDCFSLAMTELMMKQLSGGGHLVKGQFIETR